MLPSVANRHAAESVVTRSVPSGGSVFGRALCPSLVKRKRYVPRMVAMLMAAWDRLRAGVFVSPTRSMLARSPLLRPESSMATVRLLAALSVVRAPGDRSLALSLRASPFWPPFPPLLLLAARCGIDEQHCRVGMLATPALLLRQRRLRGSASLKRASLLPAGAGAAVTIH